MDVGEQVPEVTATLDDGSRTTLSEMVRDGPVVLFFYPGCPRTTWTPRRGSVTRTASTTR
jgi:peroxiredoxin